jgi:peptidoglycan-associated lipoprotein
MKTRTRLFVIFLFLLSGALLTSCAKEKVGPYPSGGEGKDIDYASPQYSETGPSQESLETNGIASTTTAGAFGSLADQSSDEYKKMYGRSSEQFFPIYFDFDQATIRSDQFSTLEHNADYLKNNPSARVVIEGNCDERGTNEYNLALGERRALSAKAYLVELGIEEHRIRTVSFGEERPLFFGQDEFSFAQNRRDDFVLD